VPRYLYECCGCLTSKIVFHSINDKIDIICDNCNNIMDKVISKNFSTNFVQKNEQKVGQLTKEYIEKNRKVLEQQKEEARKDTHE
tara:strand:+ start:747 stop:1001 length:255 start_codon:yes stop_codon:yes gene_type:complete